MRDFRGPQSPTLMVNEGFLVRYGEPAVSCHRRLWAGGQTILWFLAAPRRLLRLMLGSVLAVISAAPALACLPAPLDPPLHQKAEIAALVRNATVIDLAVVEAIEARDSSALAKQVARIQSADPKPAMILGLTERVADFGPATYHYRLVERLKGPAPRAKVFSLQGMTEQVKQAAVAPPRQPHVRELTLGAPFRELIEEATPQNLAESFCSLHPFGWVGMRVLIFRGADGGLLGRTIPHQQRGQRAPILLQGSVYRPADDPRDPWVTEVRRLLAQPPSRSR